jgi:hypothetical protein
LELFVKFVVADFDEIVEIEELDVFVVNNLEDIFKVILGEYQDFNI